MKETYEKFMKWLASSNTDLFTHKDCGYDCAFIKIPKGQSFLYLFCQHLNGTSSSLDDSDFKFCGIYCLQDSKIYCASGVLLMMDSSKELESRTKWELKKQMEKKVREKVEVAVGNDRKNLRVTEVSDEELLSHLDDMRHGSAAAKAREYFLNGKPLDSIVFTCQYSTDNWWLNTILKYILNPDEFVEKEYKSYMDANQERMLLQFIVNDMISKEYTAILSDPTNPIHIVKRIVPAVKHARAKTVAVTILKNGKQFSFRSVSYEFFGDAHDGYDPDNIVAEDRRLYRQEFGFAHYKPQEVLRITYGRKVLYEAEK